MTYVNALPVYPGFNEVGACFKKTAEADGYKPVEVATPGSAIDNQDAINLMRQAIADGTNAILGFFPDDALFAPVIKEARAKGIYVGGFDSGDRTTGQQFVTGTEWPQAGALVADGVGRVRPDATVGFLSVSPTSTPQAQAIAGFKAEAAKKFPHMKFVGTVYDNGDPTQDVSQVGNLLAAHPDINVLFLVPGNTAGGLTAVKEHGDVHKILVVSGDLTPQHRAAIASGAMYGVTVQDWCGFGSSAVRLFHDLAAGKSIPFIYKTHTFFATKQNEPKTGV